MDGCEVQLHVYELTKGLARALSPMFLGGKQINGVWHTGIVAYNQEFYFGSMGIQSCQANTFFLGKPDDVVPLGKTQIPYEVFMEHLEELGSTTFRGSCYHLFDHNCNTFSNELANFLTGKSIPAEITDLPREINDTPIGAMIKQFVDSMQNGQVSLFPEMEPGSGVRNVVNSITGANDISQNKPKDSRGSSSAVETLTSDVKMSHTPDASAQTVPFGFEKGCHREMEPGSNSPPLTVYSDEAVLTMYRESRDTARGLLRPNEFQSVEEVFEYLSLKELDWSLCRSHLSLLCSLLTNDAMRNDIRLISGLLLQRALTHSDFVVVCIHDSTHCLQNLIRCYDALFDELLTVAAKCLCNFLAERQSVEWMLQSSSQEPKSFADDAFALCAHCLLSDNRDLAEIGCRIASNVLQNGKVSDNLVLKMGVALTEVVCYKSYSEQSEDFLWFSLCECMKINNQIAELAKTMELNLKSEEEKRPSITKHTKSIQHLFL